MPRPPSPGRAHDAALTVRRNWISSSPSPPSAMAPRSSPGPAPEPCGDRRRRPLALRLLLLLLLHLPLPAAGGNRGPSCRCRSPGRPRLQSPGDCAGGRAGAAEARGLPAPHCAGGGRPSGGRGEAARSAAALAACSRQPARPRSSERVRGAGGARVVPRRGRGGGGRGRGEELAVPAAAGNPQPAPPAVSAAYWLRPVSGWRAPGERKAFHLLSAWPLGSFACPFRT